MPSSTSNSKLRTPTGAWSRTWTLAVLLTVVAAIGLELFWRGRGHELYLRDDAPLWAAHRASVYPRAPSERVLVLLGGSRMQLDVDVPTLARELPGYRPVQLAIDGSDPWPALRDLAADTGFRGTVIVSLQPRGIVERWGRTQEYVTAYHTAGSNLNTKLNKAVGQAVESHLVFRSASLSLRRVIGSLIEERELPRPAYIRTTPDRSRQADYTLTDADQLKRYRIGRAELTFSRWVDSPPSYETFQDSVAVLAGFVTRIRARGGSVAVVRLPVGEEIGRYQEAVFPRDRFWDPLASEVDAVFVHFEDEPTLVGFSLPDASHLDYRDTAAFTRALVQVLIDHGVVEK